MICEIHGGLNITHYMPNCSPPPADAIWSLTPRCSSTYYWSMTLVLACNFISTMSIRGSNLVSSWNQAEGSAARGTDPKCVRFVYLFASVASLSIVCFISFYVFLSVAESIGVLSQRHCLASLVYWTCLINTFMVSFFPLWISSRKNSCKTTPSLAEKEKQTIGRLTCLFQYTNHSFFS
jgi:hypothetical protein